MFHMHTSKGKSYLIVNSCLSAKDVSPCMLVVTGIILKFLCWGPNIPREATLFGSLVPDGVNTTIL
jgi:hypothetical protein